MAAGTDGLGNALSGASPNAREFYGKALTEFQVYTGDPVATVGQALEDSPGFVMGHALRAWLHLLGTEPFGVPVAREALAAARALPATAQERGHLAAIAHVVEGDSGGPRPASWRTSPSPSRATRWRCRRGT
jgi:hypothetical protein